MPFPAARSRPLAPPHAEEELDGEPSPKLCPSSADPSPLTSPAEGGCPAGCVVGVRPSPSGRSIRNCWTVSSSSVLSRSSRSAVSDTSVTPAADSWAAAFVDFNSTVRQLTEDLMDSFLSGLFDFGAISREDAVILTGRDTADVLSDLDDDKRIVYDPSNGGRESVNDAETTHGIPGTGRLREYKGIPVVDNQNAPAHGPLSSIYVIPTDTMTVNGQEVPRICVEEYATPYVETAGRGETQGFLSQGNFQNKVLYKMDHEIVCRDFSSTGKLRDLKE